MADLPVGISVPTWVAYDPPAFISPVVSGDTIEANGRTLEPFVSYAVMTNETFPLCGNGEVYPFRFSFDAEFGTNKTAISGGLIAGNNIPEDDVGSTISYRIDYPESGPSFVSGVWPSGQVWNETGPSIEYGSTYPAAVEWQSAEQRRVALTYRNTTIDLMTNEVVPSPFVPTRMFLLFSGGQSGDNNNGLLFRMSSIQVEVFPCSGEAPDTCGRLTNESWNPAGL